MATSGSTWKRTVDNAMKDIEAYAKKPERTCLPAVEAKMTESKVPATTRKIGYWRRERMPQSRLEAETLERALIVLAVERGVPHPLRKGTLISLWKAAHPQSVKRIPGTPDPNSVFEKYEAHVDGVYKMWDWSLSRPLDHLAHTVSMDPSPPRQNWIPARKLAAEQARLRRPPLSMRGDVVYATDFSEDHLEHAEADGFRLKLATSSWGDAVAAANCLSPNELRTLLSGPRRDVIRTMPPCRLSVSVAIAVDGPDGPELFAHERGQVSSDKKEVMFGISETMKRKPDWPERSDGGLEDLYATAVRGLEEEAGLRAGDVGPIRFSYFCVICPKSVADDETDIEDRGYIVQHALAQTACRLDKARWIEVLNEVHSSYELGPRAWIPYDDTSLSRVIRRADRRRWICFGPQSAIELWRYKKVITNDLHKIRAMSR